MGIDAIKIAALDYGSNQFNKINYVKIFNEDNVTNRMNKPDKDTTEWWSKLKKIGNIAPKIEYSDVVFIGLRDVEPEESYLLKKHKVKVFSTNEVKRNGVEKIARDALAHL